MLKRVCSAIFARNHCCFRVALHSRSCPGGRRRRCRGRGQERLRPAVVGSVCKTIRCRKALDLHGDQPGAGPLYRQESSCSENTRCRASANGFQSTPSPVDVAAGQAGEVRCLAFGSSGGRLAEWMAGADPAKWAASRSGCMNRRRRLSKAMAKQIVMSKCTQCHETERIVLLHFDRAKWESTIDRMREYIA